MMEALTVSSKPELAIDVSAYSQPLPLDTGTGRIGFAWPPQDCVVSPTSVQALESRASGVRLQQRQFGPRISSSSIPAATPASRSSASVSPLSSTSWRQSSPTRPNMAARPLKRPAGSSGDDGSNDQGAGVGKTKLARLSGSEDFSSVVKHRLQSYTRTGQACDRCKVRKIRCDALPEGCSHCINQNLECYVTDRVTGRTERRGYLQELEREKNDMLSHIRNLEKLLEDQGLEVRPWQWTPYNQYPPGVTFDNMGNPVQDPGTQNSWRQIGTVWVKNASATSILTPNFPRSLLESRPENSHLGVGADSAPLSSIKGTRLSILGTTIDLASFDAPDVDEPPLNAKTSIPLYNKSTQAFLQSVMNVNPPVQADLPSREDAFTYSEWYFLTFSSFLPILHKPSFMGLLASIYDDPNFLPSAAQLVIVHMVLAIIYFQYGVRNWQQAEQRRHLNDLSNKHYHFALSKLFGAYSCRDITTVQAMALVAAHTRSFPKPGCGSIIANLALQRALELNLHREPKNVNGGTNLEIEMRKRIWWTILTVNVAITGRRGRPMPITVEEFDVGFPEPIADELLTDNGVDATRTLPCPIQAGIAGFKMVPILMEMYSNIYSVRRDAQNYLNIVNALEAQLDRWEEELPGHLKLDHPEQTEQTRMAAVYARTYALELRMCLRHPSVAMTKDEEVLAENTRICVESAREMLQRVQELQKLRCLDTTWYQTSVYTAAIFSMLVAQWERRYEAVAEDIALLREEMSAWVSILEEMGSLLGSGPRITGEISAIIDRTIAWIEHDMHHKDPKSSLSVPPRPVKEESQSQTTGYPPPRAHSALADGNGPSDDVVKSYYHDSGLNSQAAYPALTYADQTTNTAENPMYNTEAAMFYNTSAQATTAAAVAVPNGAVGQANPLVAFASQATQHISPNAPEMLWQSRGNTWHDWAAAISDSQERFSASALLTLGGNTRGSTVPSGIPDPSAPQPTEEMNHATQWPMMLFDNSSAGGP